MNLWIVVDGRATRVVVADEEATIMVERDYQERLNAVKDKSTVQRRTPQAILNTLYGREKDSEKRLHEHWVRPSYPNKEDEREMDSYEPFAVAKRNQGTGYSYRNLERLTTDSAESQCVNAIAEEKLMQLLQDNLTPEQMDLVVEVIIKDRPSSLYAKEHNVTKSAITHRMETIRKKLQKILKASSTFTPLLPM